MENTYDLKKKEQFLSIECNILVALRDQIGKLRFYNDFSMSSTLLKWPN